MSNDELDALPLDSLFEALERRFDSILFYGNTHLLKHSNGNLKVLRTLRWRGDPETLIGGIECLKKDLIEVVNTEFKKQ